MNHLLLRGSRWGSAVSAGSGFEQEGEVSTVTQRRIVVNGEAAISAASNLSALLEQMGYGGQKVATARNGEFVPERRRADHRLEDGDRIEIVAPRQGG